MNSTTPTRRLPLVLAGGVAGIALAIAAPLAASAHVHVDPVDAAAGTTSTLTFSFSHGCDDSPTTALVFDVPDAADVVTPVAAGGWSITRDLGDDGLPDRVTYTADRPIESGVRASISLDVLLSAEAAETTVAFPVTQECVEGVTAWTQVAAEGEDAASLDSPAPTVAVGAVAAASDGHGHGAGGDDDAASADSEEHADHADPAASDASATGSDDVVARVLGGTGLIAGIAALVLVLLRTRRSRA